MENELNFYKRKAEQKKRIHFIKCCVFFVISWTVSCFAIASANTPPDLPVSSPVVQQQRTITGVVRDASGPVIGANVIVKGTTNGDVTNIDGQFTISNVQPNAVLQVSYIGYLTQEVNVANRTQFEIVIQEDVEMLDELVVVGYGTLQRRDVTGSVAQVQAEQISGRSTPRVDQALVGQIAGVQVISNTGSPGTALNIRIRGVGSITAGSAPLYVVDGFPMTNIDTLNPNDIETIDILKDASSTAIYGSRGSNGVVLITTKRGKEGTARISFDAYYGWQKAMKFPKYLTMQEQAHYYYEAYYNQNVIDGGDDPSLHPTQWTTEYLPQLILDVIDGTYTTVTDAYKELYRTAPQQNYTISAQGGNDNLRYSMSGTYFAQDGIVLGNWAKRYSMRANLDAKLNKRVSVQLNFNSSFTDRKTITERAGAAGQEGIIGTSDTWLYWIPFYEEDGSYKNTFGTEDPINSTTNPMAVAKEILRRSEGYRTMGNLVTDIRITDDLLFKVSIGATHSTTHSWYFIPDLGPVFAGITPGGEDRRSLNLNWLTESTLTYNKRFNKHSINALAGYTTQMDHNSSNFLSSRSYPNNLIYTLNAVSNNLYQGNSQEEEWSLISYLARINYNYDSKYYITASIRSDGSSRFGKDSKYGTFPSLALMWRMSGESFMQNVSALSDLRLRVSYGSTGNNDIGNYEHYALVSYPSHIFGSQAIGGMAPSNLENTVLTWEKQRSVNFAIDASLFRSRINFTAEYYVARNHQLLYNVNIPMISGFTRALQNIGEVENKGWDFTLKTHNVSGIVNWHTDFNISTFKNKVLKLGPEGDPIINTMHITQIGSPVGMFYGHITDGVFKTQAELDAGPIWGNGAAASHVGDIRFKDLNGDGIITAADDRTIIGNPYPDFYGGLTNTVSYKDFQLSVAIQYNYGNDVGYTQDYKLYTRAKYKQFPQVKDHWCIVEGSMGNGTEPRPHNNPTGGVREKSNRYLDDGSFLKVSNINLSYNFPRKIVQNLQLASLRLYTTVNNPFMFTKFKDSNPEVSNNSSALQPGMFDYNYPLATSLLFGINVSF